MAVWHLTTRALQRPMPHPLFHGAQCVLFLLRSGNGCFTDIILDTATCLGIPCACCALSSFCGVSALLMVRHIMCNQLGSTYHVHPRSLIEVECVREKENAITGCVRGL